MSDLTPDNDKILSDHLPTAIEEYLRVCGRDLKHNAFHLLSESGAEIERLERVVDLQNTYLANKDSVIKGMNAENQRLRAALRSCRYEPIPKKVKEPAWLQYSDNIRAITSRALGAIE